MLKLKGYITLFLSVFILCLAGGCSNKKDVHRNEISVSILPFKYFAEELAGKGVKVNCMLSPGDNPSTYQPTPQQIGGLEKSALYFKNGHLVFEEVWMGNMEANNPRMRVVDCSAGIDLLDGHEHHNEAHSVADEHLHHEEVESRDPHYWLLPSNAQIIVTNMYQALKASELVNSDSLEQNYLRLSDQLQNLAQQLDGYLISPQKKGFLIYHPALSYIAQKYNIEQLAIEQEGKTPSVAQIKDVLEHAKAEGFRTIFIQKQFDKDNATLIAKEIDGEIVVIDPLAYNYPAQMIDIGIKFQKALNE